MDRLPAVRAPWRTLLLIGALSLLIRLGLSLRDLDALDRLFVPDDTYYTLSIARSLGLGNGPIAHTQPTNGFQPLTAFLLAPLCRVLSGHDAPLRAALMLSALSDVASVVLLGRLAGRVSPRAGNVAAFAWALSPIAVANALNGLETSLAVATQLGFVEAVCWARERPSTRRWALVGAMAGLAQLARVDAVFLLLLVAGFELVRGDRRGILVAAGAGAVVVSPWWLYELARFHTIVPESGQAVRVQTTEHALGFGQSMGWAAGNVLGAPFLDLPDLRQWLFFRPAAGVVAFVLLSALVALAAFRLRHQPALALLSLTGVVLLVFYATYLPAVWFFRRYLALPQAIVTLLFAVLVALPEGRRARLLSSVLAIGASLVGGVVTALYFVVTPTTSVDVWHHGIKGYRLPAKQIVAMTPPGSVVGALQSGALGWYATGAPITIVNLDGVVDGESARAFRDHTLDVVATRRGVTHLADWPFNLQIVARHCARPFAVRPIGVSAPQSRPFGGPAMRFELLEIRF